MSAREFDWLETEPPDDPAYEMFLLEKHKNTQGTNAAANGWTYREWQDYVRYELKHFKAAYVERDDLFAPWRAYEFCRACSIPAPGWVLDYLGRVAANMDRLSRRDGRPARPLPPDLGAAVLEALEMARPGRGTALTRRRTGMDDRIIGACVLNELVAGGCIKLSSACKRAAERFGISPEKARLAWAALGLTKRDLEAMRQEYREEQSHK